MIGTREGRSIGGLLVVMVVLASELDDMSTFAFAMVVVVVVVAVEEGAGIGDNDGNFGDRVIW